MNLVSGTDWQGPWLASIRLVAAGPPEPPSFEETEGLDPEDLDLQGKRLLVVEDDRAIREVLRDLLQDAGYAVEATENGARALELLRRGPRVDLIILDLRMPVMDGWEFRATQRDDPALATIPVLAVSADGSAQAKAVDAAAYLHKPLRSEEVLASVRRILRQGQRPRDIRRLAEAERLAALGRLAAGVGHEINNPLTYVSMNVSYLACQLRAAGLEEAERFMQVDNLDQMLSDAQFGLERIRQIVDNLQVISRRTELKLDGVHLEGLLDRVLAMADHQVRPRARLVKRYHGVHLLTANPGTLSQLFLNLVTNAAQAIEEGRTSQNEVTVTTRTEGDFVVVEVIDTGRGIPPAVMLRIFEPFYTTKAEGTGLGLAISKQIVEEHGGEIAVESPAEGGTKVLVRLPYGEDAQVGSN